MIYNEDCLITMHDRITSGSIDMVLTSPPYDNLRKYGGYCFDFPNTARALFDILAPGGVLVWVVGDSTLNGSESGNSFRQALFFLEIGFNLHDTMIYQKKNYIPLSHNRYEQSFEYIFVLAKGRPNTFNPIKIPSLTAGNVINMDKRGAIVKEGASRRRPELIITNFEKIAPNIFTYACGNMRNGHPAVFPYELARDMIYTWSNPEDLIYDPFAGSGTTMEAAFRLKRNCLVSEINAQYCNIIHTRILPL